MITVACVLRTGTHFGADYDASWVRRLRRGVSEHLAAPHRFVCLTNVPDAFTEDVGIEARPLWHEWPGYWSKIELFREPFGGPVLYLDLDSLIIGDLAPLFDQPGDFLMVPDFHKRGWGNSSAMFWEDDWTGIYRDFLRDPDGAMGDYHRTPEGRVGDQAFIEDIVEPEFFPEGMVASYKIHAKNAPPAGAAVVTFHGRPKPHQANGWVKGYWNA